MSTASSPEVREAPTGAIPGDGIATIADLWSALVESLKDPHVAPIAKHRELIKRWVEACIADYMDGRSVIITPAEPRQARINAGRSTVETLLNIQLEMLKPGTEADPPVLRSAMAYHCKGLVLLGIEPDGEVFDELPF